MNTRLLLAAAALPIWVNAAASAQTIIGTFKHWVAYTENNGVDKMCVIQSQPIASKYSQAIAARGSVYFFVTSMPAKHIGYQASTLAGYPFAAHSRVRVEIDGISKFTMAIDKDTAWIGDPDRNVSLIAAMRTGHRMVVTGRSSRGTTTTDTYSLAGVTAALTAIAKKCP
jgi:hypothetical protein